MDNLNMNIEDNNDEINIKEEFFRYFSFWPFFLISIFTTLIFSFIYLRYADYQYESVAKVQIIDKAQDSEMALPTAMTIFNRSMVNLENETGVLTSYSLHRKAVEKLNANIKYYSVGRIKTTINHSSEWFKDYEIKFNPKSNVLSDVLTFEITTNDNGEILIDSYNKNGFVKSYLFPNKSTLETEHSLPFDLTLNKYEANLVRILKILPVENTVKQFRDLVKIEKSGNESDQLVISTTFSNVKIAEEYINTLLNEFDKDGIVDRQLEYKNTIEFVDIRSKILSNELEQIELRKQKFKADNNLSDLKFDASTNIKEKFEYDGELFKTQSQLNLLSVINESLTENNFSLIPVNIGLENSSLNTIIAEYNLLIKEREKYLLSAGANNSYVKALEKQLDSYYQNILSSIENYKKNLQMNYASLEAKESEFQEIYNNVPENEKILRSIERELNVKEALFLLLLQKKEEASINFAVVKPTIKVIDNAKSSKNPVSPNRKIFMLFSAVAGFLIPFTFLYIKFYLDSKIHIKQHLEKYTKSQIPVIGEIPFIDNTNDLKSLSHSDSRTPLSESIRMIIANLNFTNIEKENSVILVTSTIKGEGKTVVSVNTASILKSRESKVLLIGADLRNPQIHKMIQVEKDRLGLSDLIYKDELDKFKDFLISHENIDILLSGTIPPNPTELLSSERFKSFIEKVKNEYDYVVIDSAPCLLVSDTFEISKLVDTTLYVVRANFSDIKLCDFILENKKLNKLKNINLILNAVGKSDSYGYKYGYQYGYRYGYKYGYNYGYGYGYNEDK